MFFVDYQISVSVTATIQIYDFIFRYEPYNNDQWCCGFSRIFASCHDSPCGISKEIASLQERRFVFKNVKPREKFYYNNDIPCKT